MCFTLYIGTGTELPEIPWDEAHPGFNVSSLAADESTIRQRFSLPAVKSLGADTHCGCGFRHSLLDGDAWYPVVSDDAQALTDERNIHQALYDYITSHVKEGKVELFGCWNGDGDGEPLSRSEINCMDLLHDNFYFKESGFYTVDIYA